MSEMDVMRRGWEREAKRRVERAGGQHSGAREGRPA